MKGLINGDKTLACLIIVIAVLVVLSFVFSHLGFVPTDVCPADMPKCEPCAHNLTYFQENRDCCTKGVGCP